MSTQELNKRIAFVQETSNEVLVKQHLQEVFSLYFDLYGEVCTGCPRKIAGYINRIRNHKKTKVMTKQKRKYRLREGVIIPIPGTSEAYSNHNLTDEIAEKLLKDNPNRRILFAEIPGDFEGGSGDEAPAEFVVVRDLELTVSEGIDLLAEIGITSKATTIEGVQKRFDSLKPEEEEKLAEVLSEDPGDNEDDYSEDNSGEEE